MNWDKLMAEALDLALQGRGEVEPNPRVGALALQGDQIVGRGFHPHWGGPHAEVVALQDAAARGGRPDTVVVTFEPCSTKKGQDGKKTEPCLQRLLDAGIRRVVVGAADPDPRHRRAGIAGLAEAGVEVIDGVQASRCRQINHPFTRWLGLDRPWVIAKWAMTLDGKTAASTGEARWISGREARVRTHELRARCDAVMVGYRTALIDDPELTVRHVQGHQPIRVVVDPLAEIDDDSKLVTSAREMPFWLLCSTEADPVRTGHLQDLGVQVIQSRPVEGPRRIHLLEALRELRRRGVRRLLVEGGGGLVSQLLSWDCVDQVLAYVAPKIIGGRLSPTPVAGEGRPFMAEAWRLRELDWQRVGADLAVSGFVY